MLTKSSVEANELIQGRVRVTWIELGEGFNGDYNPDDPDDRELLRFDVSWLGDDGEWTDLDNASYCTLFPVSATPEQRRAGLEILMDAFYETSLNGYSIKKIGERMSWIDLGWLSKDKEILC